MKKEISILNDKILLERIIKPKKKQIILGVPSTTEQESYFKGKVIKIGSNVEEQINIHLNDIVVYDKYPEIIKIDDKLYDLISTLNIKYIEHI